MLDSPRGYRGKLKRPERNKNIVYAYWQMLKAGEIDAKITCIHGVHFPSRRG